MFITRCDKAKVELKRKRRKILKSVRTLSILSIMIILTCSVSYAQPDIGGNLNQWYLSKKAQSFNNLDEITSNEKNLIDKILQADLKLNVLNMEKDVEKYTKDELIPQLLKDLEKHYQELSTKIKLDNEQEKKAFRLKLDQKLEKARQDSTTNLELGTKSINQDNVEK